MGAASTSRVIQYPEPGSLPGRDFPAWPFSSRFTPVPSGVLPALNQAGDPARRLPDPQLPHTGRPPEERSYPLSTMSVTDIPLGAESPAQRLRRTAAAVRVMLHWWGVHRALTSQQTEEFGAVTSADARLLTAGKKLGDTRHDAFRRLTSVGTRISSYGRPRRLAHD